MAIIKFNYQPHDKQKEIHLALRKIEKNFFTIVVAGRQSGKSHLLRFQGEAWANESGAKNLIWYVCPSENQAKKVYREMVEDMLPLGLIKSKMQSKGDIHIETNSGSKIEFKSAGSEDTLRGNSVTHLICDEFAFFKKEVFTDILLPTMGVKGLKVVIASTPKGKNFFHELWMRGVVGSATFNPDYKSFKFTSLDNPYAKPSVLESIKASLPEPIYRQEILAEWIDSASIFQHIQELAVMNSNSVSIVGESYFVGCDIALINDYTVICVLNSKGEQVYMDRFNNTDINEVVGRVRRVHDIFKPKKLVIESNNQGLPVIILLRTQGIKVQEFDTQGQSKVDLINNLIASFSGKEIRILNDEQVKNEFDSFIFKFTDSGKVQFEAGHGHDDIVMATAIAWHGYASSTSSGQYYVLSSTTPLGQSNLPGFIPKQKSNEDYYGVYLKRNEDAERNEF